MRYDAMRIDIVDLLERLEVDNVIEATATEVNYSCPFLDGHTLGDSTPSAYMSKEKNVFFCHGCHASGTVVDFIVKLRQVTPLEALRFLREHYGMEYREPEGGSLIAERQAIEERRARREQDSAPPRRPDEAEWLGPRGGFAADWRSMRMAHAMGVDTGPGSYMLDRGFLVSTLKSWQLGYDAWTDRVTIPVRDEEGGLVGFKGRATQDHVKPKYMVLGDTDMRRPRYGIGYGFDPYEISQVVFGLHRARVIESGRLVLCEGELDAIALHQCGVDDAVAIGGSYLSDEQVEKIRWWAKEVVLFFDSNSAGEDCAINAISRLSGVMRVRMVGPHEGDPASMPKRRSLDLIDSAEPWMRLLAGDV